MEHKEIYIEWDGPYSYQDIASGKEETEDYNVLLSDIGLYQIYGAHPVYGNNVLLYIGKTENSGGFRSRLKERGAIVDNMDHRNVQIYLGHIFYDSDTSENKKQLSEDIARAESLLIHYHRPAHNSSNINTLKYAEETYMVINIGNYRSLSNAVSTVAFTKERKIYASIDKIAKELNIKKNNMYNGDDGYGFFLDNDGDLWFGVDYDLWQNDTVLVIISNTERKGFDNYKGIYYKKIFGDNEKIVKELKKNYLNT